MKDLFDSLGEHLKDRFSSPLAGAFIVSWLLWNYKVVFTLFSDMKPWVKFGFISDQVWTDPFVTVVHVLLGPGLTAIAYILLYPFPARWVWAYNALHKRKSELRRQEIEQETPLTREEADRHRMIVRKQLDNLQLENRQLSNTLAEYRSAQQSIDDAIKVHQEAAVQAQAELKRVTLELEAREMRSAGADAKISALEGQIVALEVNAKDANAASLKNHHDFLNEQVIARKYLEQLRLFQKTIFPDKEFNFDQIPTSTLFAMLNQWAVENSNRHKK